MGDVYLARQLSLDRPVALKVIKAEWAANPTYMGRFEAEAWAAAKLSHPNIVHIYTLGSEGSVRFIAMEYVKGMSLRDYLKKRGLPDLTLAVAIMRQSGLAVKAAGEAGLVHRDIKPENLLLTKNQLKVADFGLAQLPAEDRMHLTGPGIAVGTPMYMSPEQVQGKELDTRSDLYSLGVTYYYMLTGEPPVPRRQRRGAGAEARPRARPEPGREAPGPARSTRFARDEALGEEARRSVCLGGRDARRPRAGQGGHSGRGRDPGRASGRARGQSAQNADESRPGENPGRLAAEQRRTRGVGGRGPARGRGGGLAVPVGGRALRIGRNSCARPGALAGGLAIGAKAIHRRVAVSLRPDAVRRRRARRRLARGAGALPEAPRKRAFQLHPAREALPAASRRRAARRAEPGRPRGRAGSRHPEGEVAGAVAGSRVRGSSRSRGTTAR